MKCIGVEIDKIEQNENSRTVYKSSDLSELMHSMKKDGLLQPIGVKDLGKGKYECVFGNRRLQAAKKLGWSDIMCHVLEVTDDNERDILGLIENLKRQNTSVAEDGRMFQILRDRGLTDDEISVRVGVSKERIVLATEVNDTIPKEYRKLIVNRSVGSGKKPGTIVATAAHAILNLKKSHGLTKPQVCQMLDYAKQPRANLSNLRSVAPLMRSGMTFKKALVAAKKRVRVVLFVFVDEDTVKDLEHKYKKSISTQLWDQLEKNKELGVSRELGVESPNGYRNKLRKFQTIAKHSVER